MRVRRVRGAEEGGGGGGRRPVILLLRTSLVRALGRRVSLEGGCCSAYRARGRSLAPARHSHWHCFGCSGLAPTWARLCRGVDSYRPRRRTARARTSVGDGASVSASQLPRRGQR